jgi:hypothetical protein
MQKLTKIFEYNEKTKQSIGKVRYSGLCFKEHYKVRKFSKNGSLSSTFISLMSLEDNTSRCTYNNVNYSQDLWIKKYFTYNYLYNPKNG